MQFPIYIAVTVLVSSWLIIANEDSASNDGTCACGGKRDSVLGSIGIDNSIFDSAISTNPKNYDTVHHSSQTVVSLSVGGEINDTTPTESTKSMESSEKTSSESNLKNMVFIEGGLFYMGTDSPLISTDGEGPRRLVNLTDFMIDRYEVSNEEYLTFAESTGYRSDSEVYGWSFVFDSAVPKALKSKITQAVKGAEWWLPVNGSYWREPEGPGTDVFSPSTYRGNLPAVHISWNDAAAYCSWRQARLPTEAEWEYAAQGPGRRNSKADPKNVPAHTFPWGNKLSPKGEFRANIFQGSFPTKNSGADGFEFLSPVNSFPPQNDYGVHNMIGNAWEWVEDWFTVNHSNEPSIDPKGPSSGRDKVKKGGSFLCHRKIITADTKSDRYRCVMKDKNKDEADETDVQETMQNLSFGKKGQTSVGGCIGPPSSTAIARPCCMLALCKAVTARTLAYDCLSSLFNLIRCHFDDVLSALGSPVLVTRPDPSYTINQLSSSSSCQTLSILLPSFHSGY